MPITMIVDIVTRIRIYCHCNKIAWNSDYDPCGSDEATCLVSPSVLTLLAVDCYIIHYVYNGHDA